MATCPIAVTLQLSLYTNFNQKNLTLQLSAAHCIQPLTRRKSHSLAFSPSPSNWPRSKFDSRRAARSVFVFRHPESHSHYAASAVLFCFRMITGVLHFQDHYCRTYLRLHLHYSSSSNERMSRSDILTPYWPSSLEAAGPLYTCPPHRLSYLHKCD